MSDRLEEFGDYNRPFRRWEDARGFCPSCREWVDGRPDYEYEWVDGEPVAYVVFWLRPTRCPTCGSRLRFPSEQPRCKHYRCSRWVKEEGDCCDEHAPKPKPPPRRQPHCLGCGRFVRMNPRGRRAQHCNARCRKRAERKRARGRSGS